MVDAAPHARAIVTFGDSITDRANSTPDANHRWPDMLARRLNQRGTTTRTRSRTRQAVNQWIRSSGAFDGVIDFDAVAPDPNRPAHILAAFDSGDHLHPQDDGYKAMADSIDLKLLTAQP